MEFSRVGKHTIKCVIKEAEISDLGFTLDEIMGNGERTQEFMNRIFDLAEQEFQTKFDLGIKTVRADFLPDHSLSLTFSEHPAAGGMVEHLKDIVNGLLNSIPNDKWEDIKNETGAKDIEKLQQKAKEESEAKEKKPSVIVMFKFDNIDTVTRFSKQVTVVNIPHNSLYKYENKFYMIMDLGDSTEEEVLKFSVLTDEYASDILVGAERRAYLEEHGDAILKENAIENLKEL